MFSMRRTRPAPGPLLLVTIVPLALASTALRAHDPGLSALDVSVRRDTVSVSLGLSAADVALIAPAGDAQAPLTELARTALRFTADGAAVPPTIERVDLEPDGARVHVSFTILSSASNVRRLSIASDVSRRLARGHREMLVVRVNDRVAIETLLDKDSSPVTLDVDASPSSPEIARHYVTLGIHHILGGYDHLVFLAGLILTSRRGRELLIALTAFTAAHSVSLALVVIAGVRAPSSIVEPLIAASIAWIGLESLIYGRRGARWIIVFGVGLVHGFGFAGALLELGLGSSAWEIAVALLSFNVGVEAGQLAVAAIVVPLVWWVLARSQWQSKLLPACSIMITLAGGYWLLERLV
jgi:hypothetical protein